MLLYLVIAKPVLTFLIDNDQIEVYQFVYWLDHKSVYLLTLTTNKESHGRTRSQLFIKKRSQRFFSYNRKRSPVLFMYRNKLGILKCARRILFIYNVLFKKWFCWPRFFGYSTPEYRWMEWIVYLPWIVDIQLGIKYLLLILPCDKISYVHCTRTFHTDHTYWDIPFGSYLSFVYSFIWLSRTCLYCVTRT